MAHSVPRYHYFTRYVLSVINFIVLLPSIPLHPPAATTIDSLAFFETSSSVAAPREQTGTGKQIF